MASANETIRLDLDLGQSTQKTQEFAKSLETVAVVADQQTVPALHRVDTVAEQVATSSARMGRGALEASYAIQDFTSQLGDRGLAGALNAVQNNIPGILMGFGVGGAITAGISVVSVGAGLLYQNWDKLHTLWSSDETGKEAERVKHLAEETEKANKAVEKQFEGISKEQAAPGGDLQKAIRQFGGARVRETIQRQLVAYQGDFGEEANQQFVTQLVANVNRGDPAALAMWRDMFGTQRDDISRVLSGRPTRMQEAGMGPDMGKMQRDAQANWDRQQAQRRERMERNLDRRTDQDIREEERAAAEAARADARGKQAMAQIPGDLNRGRRLLEQGRDLMRQQSVEREINRRGGGQDSYKDIQEAARRTLDLTARGVHINDAIIVAMREQGAKIEALNQHITGQDQELARLRQQGRQRQPAGMRRAFPQ